MQDVETATAALNSLQGTILYSSAAGEGMRLEYPLATSILFSLSGFSLFLFGGLHCFFTSCLWYFLNKNLDMPNRGWVCGGRRSKLCARKWKRKNQKEKLTMEKSL